MKLNKKFLIIIIAGVFVIVLVALNMVRSQQISQQEELTQKLTLTQTRLKGVQFETLAARQTDLEKQLSQSQSQLNVVTAVLAEEINSVSITNRIFELAKVQDLEVKDITSSTASSTLEGIACSVVTFNIRAQGDIFQLVTFVTQLNGLLATSTVQSLKLTAVEAGGDTFTADIQLAVYTNQGK
ncbi:MAG: hypothetical protein ABIH70_07655 [Chloroflexota bacterium]